MEKIVLFYLLSLNTIGFVVMGLDKRNAKKRKRRVKERNIWFLTIIGASIGIYLAMYFYRHKTKHQQFVFGVPFVILLQVFLLFYWIK